LSAALFGGGQRGAARGNNADAKGWATTCPKTPRFTNDTSRATAPSIRP
jgi:hypothetical protein